ncbi:hypothetical protein KP509_37G038200 [Ceratopteris richardii]|uniref:Uncharacterized protein n=1 Tax=Ceratopteris richardii TaxID=49495 RepID=A0A8T2Q805_CERRI|nr:hypothetical protein KP509_37G038200 [Ceratopteris richardii]
MKIRLQCVNKDDKVNNFIVLLHSFILFTSSILFMRKLSVVRKSCLLLLVAKSNLLECSIFLDTNHSFHQKAACCFKEQSIFLKNALYALYHLFFDCPKSRVIWHHVTRVLRLTNQINWQQVMLGEAIGCSSRLWNAIRGETHWKIWRERCAVNFGQTPKEWFIQKSLFLLGKRISRVKRLPPFRHHCIYVLENNKLKPKWVPHEGDDNFIRLICDAL